MEQVAAQSHRMHYRPGLVEDTIAGVAPQQIALLRFFFSSRRRHTSSLCDWSSDVCSSDLFNGVPIGTFAGGSGGTPLIVTFNATATPSAVQAVMRNVTYANVGATSETAPRYVRFSVTEIGRASCRERV